MLADDLATTAVTVMQKRAADLTGLRNEFENSALKEKVLRQHAQRLEDLAARRAANEDTSASGYANTLAARLAPVPHTGAEAAIRIPGMVAGGMLGHEFGKSFEPLEAEGLERVFSPLSGKGPDISGAVEKRITGLGGDPARTKELLSKLVTTPGEEISGALRRPIPMVTPRGNSQALRGEFSGLVSEGNMGKLQKAIGNLVRQTGGEGKAVAGGMSKYRLGGAAGGALLGGAAIGVPFAIRALLQKRHGGEAAVRARNMAGGATGKAEGEFKHREDLLSKLPAKTAAVSPLVRAALTGATAGGVGGAVRGGLLTDRKHRDTRSHLVEALRQAGIGALIGGAGGAAGSAVNTGLGGNG